MNTRPNQECYCSKCNDLLPIIRRVNHGGGTGLCHHCDHQKSDFHGLRIPNLDGLPDDDLEAIAAELRKVQDYIVSTLGARAARLAGKVRIAAIFEGQAESIYKTFAPELKW